ncbi:organic hydroperoxide resistance protein [Hymenobacter profundi]|uniref:Organic hydroperoxide resistance protein n=1 Tax=Hymenobacter profundi TaxID=1982110 RepID=A0ABS6X0Q9_9BACT|nr:organic hydroperoxide resistance protein [Hymenobacter profundi]MBW3129421.1 organic hydroperoxide resistance protein [Hymenobacter profundi]
MATILHTAQAKSIDGRDGHIESNDNVLNLELTMPRALGGRAREGATNPEQLFAAGYSACFGNAVIHVARQAKVNVANISVDAQVNLFMDDQQLPTLSAKLAVNLPHATQEQAEEIVRSAHQTCPYSRATRGNMEVDLVVTTNAAPITA